MQSVGLPKLRGDRAQRLLSLVESGGPMAARAVLVQRQAVYREAAADPIFRERLAAAREHRPPGPVEDWRAIARRLKVDHPERRAVPELDWTEPRLARASRLQLVRQHGPDGRHGRVRGRDTRRYGSTGWGARLRDMLDGRDGRVGRRDTRRNGTTGLMCGHWFLLSFS